MSHGATAGGHVKIGNHANIGGLAAIHQFCQVGEAAMVAGQGRVIQDVLPFTIADGQPAHMRVINKIGMERAGHSSDEISEVRKAFRILFMRELRLEEAVHEVSEALPDSSNVTMLDVGSSSADWLGRRQLLSKSIWQTIDLGNIVALLIDMLICNT